MTEIFVIAEEELVIAFNMIGIMGSAVSRQEDAVSAFHAVVHERAVPGRDAPIDLASCKMLIMTEDIADMLGSELVDWQLLGHYPLVVEIPPLAGSTPDHTKLVDAVRQAIGIRIK